MLIEPESTVVSGLLQERIVSYVRESTDLIVDNAYYFLLLRETATN